MSEELNEKKFFDFMVKIIERNIFHFNKPVKKWRFFGEYNKNQRLQLQRNHNKLNSNESKKERIQSFQSKKKENFTNLDPLQHYNHSN